MSDDQWSTEIYECSFGGVRLDVQSLRDDLSRALARHTYPHRDGADTEDMGAEPRVTNCKVIFFPPRGLADESALERFKAFVRVVNQGEPQTFVHPLLGSYKASVGTCNAEATAGLRDTIMVDVEFVEDAPDSAIFDENPGNPVLSAVDDVKASSAALDKAVDDVNTRKPSAPVSTTVGATATTEVSRWGDADGVTERDVRLAAASLSTTISSETDRLELATNIDRWPLAEALANLHYSVRRAAETFIETTPRIFEITVDKPTPLLTIAANVYGADQAADRYEQLLKLNDVRNPLRIEAGTVLRAQSANETRLRLKVPRAA